MKKKIKIKKKDKSLTIRQFTRNEDASHHGLLQRNRYRISYLNEAYTASKAEMRRIRVCNSTVEMGPPGVTRGHDYTSRGKKTRNSDVARGICQQFNLPQS